MTYCQIHCHMLFILCRPQCVNSLRPSDAYMNWSSLVQIMACCLASVKPLSDTMLEYCQLDPTEHISVKLKLKFKVFIQRNAVENVCKMAAILSQPRSVNTWAVPAHMPADMIYRKTSSISRTKSPNLNVPVSSCNCLRLIHWKQVLSWEWRCSWSSADRRCSNYIWVINNFIAY